MYQVFGIGERNGFLKKCGIDSIEIELEDYLVREFSTARCRF